MTTENKVKYDGTQSIRGKNLTNLLKTKQQKQNKTPSVFLFSKV